MRWQHLLHAKCFKVGILQFKTSLFFFLWKFQMLCFLFFSSLEHPPPCVCEFLLFSSFFTFFFFGSTTSFIFSISCCPLFSITWEKRSKLYGETRNGRSESGKRKMQRVIERHARRRRFNNFFLKFFLLLWFKPWKPWRVFRPGRFNRGLNGFMLFMYRTVFWV